MQKTNKGTPVPGKQYALTGTKNTPSIANGNTWEESEVLQAVKTKAVVTCGVCGDTQHTANNCPELPHIQGKKLSKKAKDIIRPEWNKMQEFLEILPVHKSSIELINKLAGESIYPKVGADRTRKNGDFERPLTWNEERKVYTGFLSDWDGDCRARLMYALLARGFNEVKYEALYFWTLSNNIVEISYIEGDLIAKVIN